ncbi:MAG: hypothetical protein JWL62_1919 [Hyphomicrobiales bacterium]|nr:hypothetical protein [Hyphomicrobiales bacterium]
MKLKSLSATAICVAYLWSASVLAQGRPDTLRMSCGTAAALVKRSGAIVLGTGPDIFDRYVSSHAYCDSDQGDGSALACDPRRSPMLRGLWLQTDDVLIMGFWTAHLIPLAVVVRMASRAALARRRQRLTDVVHGASLVLHVMHFPER